MSHGKRRQSCTFGDGGFFLVNKQRERGEIHNKIFNNIQHFIKNRLNADNPQDGFVMYNDEVTLLKGVVITPINASMVSVDC